MAVEIDYFKIPKIKDVILIQGVAPGVGYIGRNVAGYLVSSLNAERFAELYSDHLPPIVDVDNENSGMIISMKYEFYYYKPKKKGVKDIVIVIGDAQSVDAPGYYEISSAIIRFVSEQFGLSEVITIGGFGTGMLIEGREPNVYGATNDLEYAKKFEDLGVKFKGTEVTQIVGAAGVLIAQATRKNIPGVCLMGETSGLLLSDPKATEAVLKVLSKYLNIEIDLERIREHVKEVEKTLKKIDEMQKKALQQFKSRLSKDEDRLGYIG